MIRFDPERVRRNASAATTEDLLDRVTIFRAGMEPAALELIERELKRRGVGRDQIAAHAARRAESGAGDRRCRSCTRPAVQHRWGWHRLFGLVPLFPRRFSYCEVHAVKSS